MKKNKGFATIAIIAIVVAVLAIGGGVYYFGKSQNQNNKFTGEVPTGPFIDVANYVPPVPLKTKQYINKNYGFQFNYPVNWTIEEKSFPKFYGEAIGANFYKGLVVVMTNPNIPKKRYDCCYTPEEIEKNGIRPTLNLQIIESFSSDYPPVNQKFFGPKTKNILSELIAKGYSETNMEKLLSFVPNYGDLVDPNKTGVENTEWKDGCKNIDLLQTKENYVIKFSGCGEGVIENTGALFVRKDNLIIYLEDQASEYSKLGDFDKVLESLKFN